MAVLIWSESDGILGNSVRTGRRFSLSAEEFRPEAEALDQELDDLLDMAWHGLNLITRRQNGKPRYNTFEQVWVLGRAIYVSDILRHNAMQGEARALLWQALTPKAWYGIRHDLAREDTWRFLIPSNRRNWQKKPLESRPYDFLEIGYWLREQQLQDAGEVFSWKFSNAREMFVRSSLRSIELRQALLFWLRRQSPDLREQLVKSTRQQISFDLILKTLRKRFPARGPGSALLPQHYSEAELQAIVSEVLDAAIAARHGSDSQLPS